MIRLLVILLVMSVLASCSNTPELETGEIKTLATLQKAFLQSNQPKQFIDARLVLSRQQIDAAKIPILFVELASGQNGTLTPYPGEGIGQTWLGSDGATITTDRGILKASRGMGSDLMGSSSSMPLWSKIISKETYIRKVSYITGNNKVYTRIFNCTIRKNNQIELIEIWNLEFRVKKFKANCSSNGLEIENTFFLDSKNIVRKSEQYHSDQIGYIITERLDR